ncbi:hypothetical protein ACVDG3_21920 [Meridianimarinicoccus sp. RP-17]|uniref:hypothetical protein n=1 Tax=Meridianimarinicoccus zhengii TaxID=2056810 RepID=UPI001C9AB50E|nr:hypothetical protein [Phycocomes zhengii]
MSGQRHIGLERQDGYNVGRDPRTMTTEDLEQLGHARVSPLRALRLKCLDCCNGLAREVRLCTAVDCPSWPFRMGKNPWRRPLTGEERAERQARFAGKTAAAQLEAQNSGGEICASHPGRGRGPQKPSLGFPASLLEEDTGGAS